MSKTVRDKAREYTRTTIRRLDTLSGNQCSAPDCVNALVAKDKVSIVSKICHIEAASEEGPRFNPNMSDNDRRSYDNLILLCDECHTIIDNKSNESKYPKTLLIDWKNSSIEKQLVKLNSNTSLLKDAINIISSYDFDKLTEEELTIESFDIKNKITYNKIERNKYLIDEYKIYHAKINKLYTNMEDVGSFKKQKILRNIRHLYLREKGKVASELLPSEDIKDRSDDIIDNIAGVLINKYEDNSGIDRDDVNFGVSIIMVDAFMRCKILEVPPKVL